MQKEMAQAMAKWLSELFPKMTGAQRAAWDEILLRFSESAARAGILDYHEFVAHDGFVNTTSLKNCIERQSDNAVLRVTQVREEIMERARRRREEWEAAEADQRRVSERYDAMSESEREQHRQVWLNSLPSASREFLGKHPNSPAVRAGICQMLVSREQEEL